ncbi:DUF5779 family protein [Halalkalicoccus jeotgali]|uniref:Uncharacterized protein n=1 Tax=Halalkalicoccus jeotgali (strain DSM 18796 / CECT 7217 / JCM 14584 / KCTC 4019 / B3) TaxID=795797 RepID=D8J4M9_HALJB|nr:DUF5779 family protein [Halalkalicoccus jeotgali]ADJ15496.1 hypothetical protein HacjB3_10565 [Halalkalicoccus jeotgali B3]ELY36095.1 hypothetical protein C497_12102 [Halalkalicoccus jeotgali B3]
MADFNLDLRSVEEHIDEEDGENDTRITLGVLDGSTPPEEWIAATERGEVLVLAVEGELNELASGFAREISESGGDLVHFREFLLVTPDGVSVDTDRL